NSLLSTSRDSTYREDDGRLLDELNTNGLARDGNVGNRDSENDGAEVTPDTDTDSQEQMHQRQQGGSFKRVTPVMGNRGLETRNSKRFQHQRKDPSATGSSSGGENVAVSPVTVGALEVQNVKRAINRYGTLPKGARIGAYLESLRQNTTSEGGTTISQTSLTQESPASETGNAVVAAGANNILSPRNHIKSQPQMIRSNSSGGVTMANSASASLNKLQRHRTTTDGSMITFSSFRGAVSGSPKRSFQPTLADLEFPPPPLDLPPPPEEFETPAMEIDVLPPREPVPVGITQSQILTPSYDVSNTEPSVEEASSRFGVSLRKREPSTDSCNSLGSPAVEALADGSVKEKLEAKLVAEMKERAVEQQKVPKQPVEAKDPVSQLVNELAESMSQGGGGGGGRIDMKKLPPKPQVDNHTSFKSQLKKVEPKKVLGEKKDEAIIDFKSRLRRVECDADETTTTTTTTTTTIGEDPAKRNGEENGKKWGEGKEVKKTEIKIDIQGEKIAVEEEDKRKSTGSINSLKKLWESKEAAPENPTVVQLSPKLCLKQKLTGTGTGEEESTDEGQNANLGTSKKPAVPIKPTKLTIYATPIPTKAATTDNAASITISREGILELVTLLEGSLKIPVTAISASQWLQLSDKLNILQNSCVTFADKETMPPHSKFHFRELVTRVENQSRSLRSAGSKNVQDNEKLVLEVGQSLKQISNALHR
uniref:F-actin binding domain-containing protein n=1 Tax=Phlebotomus papatasi TaxID=29031 RepID=A0A1B0DBN7_PHLPP